MKKEHVKGKRKTNDGGGGILGGPISGAKARMGETMGEEGGKSKNSGGGKNFNEQSIKE